MNNCGKYNNNLNLVGPILRQKRVEKQISYETLSSKLLLLGVNIPVTCLHRIETNQRTVRDYEICALCIVLDLEVSDLLNPIMNEIKAS